MGSLENTHQLGPYKVGIKVGPYQLLSYIYIYIHSKGVKSPQANQCDFRSLIGCHFPEGWRDNDLNPKELKPFASGAFRHDLRQKIVVSGKAPPWSFSKLNVIDELIG